MIDRYRKLHWPVPVAPKLLFKWFWNKGTARSRFWAFRLYDGFKRLLLEYRYYIHSSIRGLSTCPYKKTSLKPLLNPTGRGHHVRTCVRTGHVEVRRARNSCSSNLPAFMNYGGTSRAATSSRRVQWRILLRGRRRGAGLVCGTHETPVRAGLKADTEPAV
jgi:hypothetical protein